jgi:hypothetical protein
VRATGEGEEILKVVKTESEHWEMARPPNEVTFTLAARALPSSGGPGRGEAFYAPPEALSAQLGAGALPAAVEAALATMAQGERAIMVVPAALMGAPAPADPSAAAAAAAGSGGGGGALAVPAAPAGAAQVELEIELQQLVQVRAWRAGGPKGPRGKDWLAGGLAAGGSRIQPAPPRPAPPFPAQPRPALPPPRPPPRCAT